MEDAFYVDGTIKFTYNKEQQKHEETSPCHPCMCAGTERLVSRHSHSVHHQRQQSGHCSRQVPAQAAGRQEWVSEAASTADQRRERRVAARREGQTHSGVWHPVAGGVRPRQQRAEAETVYGQVSSNPSAPHMGTGVGRLVSSYSTHAIYPTPASYSYSSSTSGVLP